MSVKVPPMSTPTRSVMDIGYSAASVSMDGLVPLDLGHLAPAARGAHLRAELSRRREIDAPGFGVHDHAVIRLRARGGEDFVAHVAQHGGRIAFERVAPAAAAGQHMAEHVALVDRHRELRGDEPVVGVRIEIVLGRAPGAAAIKAERPVIAAVRAHLQHRFVLEETIVAPERNAAAEFAGAGLVGHEFVSRDRQRHFGLGDLDRLRRHVRHHVRVAVEPVGPRAAAPGAAGEIHIDERLARLVVAADRDAGVAAVARRRHLVGQHHGERAEHAVHHAEAGQAARRAGGRQHAVADRARRADHVDRTEHAFVARNDLRQHRAHRAIGRRLGERQRVVDRAFDLRAGAGPVDHHAAAGLADGDEQADRLAVIDRRRRRSSPRSSIRRREAWRAPRGSAAPRGRARRPSGPWCGPGHTWRGVRRTAARRYGRRRAARADRPPPGSAAGRSAR